MTDVLPRERILLVEDDRSFRRALAEVLEAHGYLVSASPDAQTAFEVLQTETIDTVVTDLVMPGIRGEALLEQIRSTFPAIPVIAITAFGSVESALELTRAGAADYFTKPFRTRALLDGLERVLSESRTRRQQAHLRRVHGAHLEQLVGTSPVMLRLCERIGRVARSPAPVLITGPSGTGKELVARAVHDASGRGRFVPLNCAAIPGHLMESELFGHSKGAFTGAESEKPGLFEAADAGTLFLDEVAELPLELQPKLLRAIESRDVRRVGDVSMREVDVRIIAATHLDLKAAVDASTFREDLYWRLNVLHLETPRLRERPDDIPLLVESFLARAAEREGSPPLQVTPTALAALVSFHWAGNVRQLFNVLERAVAFADDPEIGLEDLPDDVRRVGRSAQIVHSAAERGLTIADLEREYILEILHRTAGNKTRAAELLGIPRRTLYRRLAEYGLTVSVPPGHTT